MFPGIVGLIYWMDGPARTLGYRFTLTGSTARNCAPADCVVRAQRLPPREVALPTPHDGIYVTAHDPVALRHPSLSDRPCVGRAHPRGTQHGHPSVPAAGGSTSGDTF